jgi:hypothetical protein
MWEAYRLSQQMKIRPSELYNLGDYPGDPVAFWFDRAVVNFGMAIEEDLEKIAEGQKTEKAAASAVQSRLLRWLDFDDSMTQQRYRTPVITKGGN